MKSINYIIFIISFLCAIFWGNGTPVNGQEKTTHRMDSSFSFEHLSPNDLYGDRKTFNLSYFSTPSPGFTYFLQAATHNRLEDDGYAGTIGSYKDWNTTLYTYSAISIGSNTSYLPELRIDHDFNFKLGKKKSFILTVGGSYIDYYSDHNDLILSGGPTFYWKKYILQYRFFYNQSNPGSVTSHSQLISVGHGEEKKQWTWLSYSFGNQAYLATFLVRPEEVKQDSFEISLKHRHWLGKNYGIFGDASYFELESGYEKVGFSVGFFYEF